MEDAALSPAIPFAPPAETADGASDAALMERVRAGDAEAFEPIVRRYQNRLFGYLLNLTADPSLAADLAQDTFVRAFRAARRYQETGRFEAWLFRIAGNLARSEARRRATRGPHVSFDSAASELERSGAPRAPRRPDELASRAEVREAVRSALPRVPFVFRQALLLRDVEGWSYREIAQMLGIEEGTVKSRAHRGRRHLRDLLAPGFRQAFS